MCFSGSWSPNSACKKRADNNSDMGSFRDMNYYQNESDLDQRAVVFTVHVVVDDNDEDDNDQDDDDENYLEAVAREHNGLLVVAPQTALYHVRLQLNIDDIKIGLDVIVEKKD